MAVAGNVGDQGLLLYNRTTKQRCKIINLTTEATADIGARLLVDATRGRVSIVRDGAETLAFAYHDEGYIQLEGAFPIARNLTFRYAASERKCTCDDLLYPEMEGWYVNLSGQWIRISKVVDAHTASVEYTFPHDSIEVSQVVRMNEIVLTSGGIQLPTLRFQYTARYQ